MAEGNPLIFELQLSWLVNPADTGSFCLTASHVESQASSELHDLSQSEI